MKFVQISIRLNELGKRMAQRLPEATKALAEKIVDNTDNVEPTTPVDTGALIASKQINYPAPNHAQITYGGESAPYAGVVHEGFPHLPGPINWTRPGSGPFFFQRKLTDKSLHAEYMRRVMDALKGVLRD